MNFISLDIVMESMPGWVNAARSHEYIANASVGTRIRQGVLPIIRSAAALTLDSHRDYTRYKQHLLMEVVNGATFCTANEHARRERARS